jgi:hypothetical protein
MGPWFLSCPLRFRSVVFEKEGLISLLLCNDGNCVLLAVLDAFCVA